MSMPGYFAIRVAQASCEALWVEVPLARFFFAMGGMRYPETGVGRIYY